MPACDFPRDKKKLCLLGKHLIERFCMENKLPCPTVTVVEKEDWHFAACAYYREGNIAICLEECQWACGEGAGRNWSWPGNVTDREPYGVIAHELGHHIDRLTGEEKYAYSSDFSKRVMDHSGELPITSYCPNPAEWFAEMFRLFVTNHILLDLLRPKTYKLLRGYWKPVSAGTWRAAMGGNVPERIIKVTLNKIPRAERPTTKVHFCREPGNAKLTKGNVREIRRRHKARDPRDGQKALAKEFGVTIMTISDVLSGKTWAGIE
jgi:hypothetical protein